MASARFAQAAPRNLQERYQVNPTTGSAIQSVAVGGHRQFKPTGRFGSGSEPSGKSRLFRREEAELSQCRPNQSPLLSAKLPQHRWSRPVSGRKISQVGVGIDSLSQFD
jgi:hypothetical protein